MNVGVTARVSNFIFMRINVILVIDVIVAWSSKLFSSSKLSSISSGMKSPPTTAIAACKRSALSWARAFFLRAVSALRSMTFALVSAGVSPLLRRFSASLSVVLISLSLINAAAFYLATVSRAMIFAANSCCFNWSCRTGLFCRLASEGN
jgi:hypothetical protein